MVAVLPYTRQRVRVSFQGGHVRSTRYRWMYGMPKNVVRGAPDFVAAGDGNRETRIPGNRRSTTLSNLYRAFERSARIVDLPYIDAGLSHLAKQPDGAVRAGDDLPDRGKEKTATTGTMAWAT